MDVVTEKAARITMSKIIHKLIFYVKCTPRNYLTPCDQFDSNK